MNLLGLSPLVKAGAGIAIGAAFAGAVALTATHGGGEPKAAFNAGTIGTPTAIVEKVTTPALSFTPPAIQFPTVIPGANKGGLFGDGALAAGLDDVTAWKTYSNSKYGYSFNYPADWTLNDLEGQGGQGPHGEPAYPRQTTEVKNPVSQQGRKTPGQNCSERANDCVGLPPTFLEFAVSILPSPCVPAGNAIAHDTGTLSGKQGTRCVEEYPNDKARGVAFSLPLAGGDFLQVSISRGNSATASMEATLETLLSTFSLK